MDASEYRRLSKIEDRHWWFRAIHKLVIDMVKDQIFSLPRSDPSKPLLILDAGCGTGGLTNKLKSLGWVAGIDSSLYALTLDNVREFDKIQGSVNQLPFENSQFGFVTSISVLCQQGVDDVSALREVNRVLAPEGKVVVILPAFQWAWSKHDEAVHSRTRYSLEEAVKIVRAAGFSIVNQRYIFSLLFPIFLMKRFLEKQFGDSVVVSDLALLPSAIDHLFFSICRLEQWLSKWIKLPFGSSLLVVGEKK